MRAYILTELMSLTRAELCALHRRIVDALAQLPEASAERLIALANLRAIGECWCGRICPRAEAVMYADDRSASTRPHTPPPAAFSTGSAQSPARCSRLRVGGSESQEHRFCDSGGLATALPP